MRNQFEKGRPLSRLNAQACRDAAARELRHVQALSTIGMQAIAVVPARLLVLARKTSTKPNAESEASRVSRSVMQKH